MSEPVEETCPAEETCPGGVPWRLVGVIGRGRLARMQMLQDAIAWRQVRSMTPCGACRALPPGKRCDDHARDLGLIASYRHALRMADMDLSPMPAQSRPSLLADPGQEA